MDAAPLYSLYDAFAGDRHTFLYSGQFLDAHTARLITLGEAVVGSTEADRSMRARLAFVLVEAYQNVIRHRPSSLAGSSSRGCRCLLLLRSAPGLNEVTTMNPILRSDAEDLVAELKGLGALDRDQLKTRYLETLQREGRTRRGGAGLGLIEMARRSGNVLRHSFTDIDAEHLRFTLSLDVDPAPSSSSGAADLQRWHSAAAEAGVTLFYKGLDNAAAEVSLLRIIDQETANDRTLSGRVAPLARVGLEVLRSLGSQHRHNAIALLQHEGRTSIGLLARLPVEDAEQASRTIHTMGDPPRGATPAQQAILALARAAGKPLRVSTTPAGDGTTRMLIPIPVGQP